MTTGHGSPAAVTLQAAVTSATAATLGLHPGTVIQLGRDPAALLGDPSVRLKVTGILRPADPSAAFWTHDPSLAGPTPARIGNGAQIWQGGVFIGPAELPALETAETQGTLAPGDVQAFWDSPLDTRALTGSQVPGAIQAMTTLQGRLQETGIVVAGSLPAGLGSPNISVQGVGNLTDFEATPAAVGATDSLLTVGLFAVAIILLLVCALVVAVAYRAELALLRARGASTVQVARRTAVRTAVVTGPALAAGALAAVLAIPGGADPASWRLLAVVAVITVAAPALLVGWQHRGPRSLATSGRGDVVSHRRSARRMVAELGAIIAIAGGVAGLRARGLAPGARVDPYISSAPVLVALAAGLIAAWVYPWPLRALLRLTAARRGTVGYLGIARAARARPDTLLPGSRTGRGAGRDRSRRHDQGGGQPRPGGRIVAAGRCRRRGQAHRIPDVDRPGGAARDSEGAGGPGPGGDLLRRPRLAAGRQPAHRHRRRTVDRRARSPARRATPPWPPTPRGQPSRPACWPGPGPGAPSR